MDVDVSLALGTTLMCLSLPSLFAALADGRFPMVAIGTFVVGIGLILWIAVALHGGMPASADAWLAFVFEDIPEVVSRIPHAFYEIAGRVIAVFY